MPFIGSISSNGEKVVSSATTSLEEQNLTFSAGIDASTVPLRAENMSRATASITRVGGGAGGTGSLDVRISTVWYPVATFAVGALGTPVTLSQHISCKDVRVTINPGASAATFSILLMVTGTS